MKLMMIAVMLAWSAPAQNIPPIDNPNLPRYHADHTATNAAMKVTIQGNGNNDQVFGEDVFVGCTVATTITFSQNGTAATATALALKQPIGAPQGSPPSAFSASDVGAGTTGRVFQLAAGEYQRYKLDEFSIRRQAPTNANFSVASSATTGVCVIYITFRTKFN